MSTIRIAARLVASVSLNPHLKAAAASANRKNTKSGLGGDEMGRIATEVKVSMQCVVRTKVVLVRCQVRNTTMALTLCAAKISRKTSASNRYSRGNMIGRSS